MGEDMMKKFTALILAAIIAALLCSCSGGKILPDAPTLASAASDVYKRQVQERGSL